MATAPDDLNRLSGIELPLILRKKLKTRQEASEEAKGDGNDNKDDDKETSDDQGDAETPSVATADSRVFTSEELEERIWRAKMAMADIQKQLCRGEESYHEETNAHGNLFKGWDAFIDAKDVGSGASATQSLGMGNRRMPADNRWFSTSCASVGRLTRPTRKLTENRVPSVRSATATPVPAPSSADGHQPGTGKNELGGEQETTADGGGASSAPVTKDGSQKSAMGNMKELEASQPLSSAKTSGEQVDAGHSTATTPSVKAMEQPKTDSGRRTRKRKSGES